jgi:hypothetical protein
LQKLIRDIGIYRVNQLILSVFIVMQSHDVHTLIRAYKRNDFMAVLKTAELTRQTCTDPFEETMFLCIKLYANRSDGDGVRLCIERLVAKLVSPHLVANRMRSRTAHGISGNGSLAALPYDVLDVIAGLATAGSAIAVKTSSSRKKIMF